MNVCVIPVKPFSCAKERLSDLLSPGERATLAQAMYQDVLAAVMQTARRSRILVVSADPVARDLAKRSGAVAYAESDPRGQSASVELAARLAHEMGGTALLALPIDVPLITPADVIGLWARFRRLRRRHGGGTPLALMAPARDGQGTNALLRCPPDSLACRFGPDSLRRHMQAAAAAGVVYDLWENPRLALDIDTPEDLAAFLAFGPPAAALHTGRALRRMNAVERVP